MNFGFFTDQDTTRFCYLRLRRLKQAIKDPKVLEALVQELEVPGKGMTAIERRIEDLRGTKSSMWYGVPAPEVLAASIFEARQLTDGVVQGLFSHTPREEDLAAPIITWLKGGGLTPIQGIPFGPAHLDVVGYRKAFLSGTRVVAVAMKNDPTQIDGALDVMKTVAPYTNATYLACTPAAAAEYLAAHAAAPGVRHWDAEALGHKLRASGSGLLLVEGGALSQAVLPKERTLADDKLREIDGLVAAMKPG